jgi:hypothetical protein
MPLTARRGLRPPPLGHPAFGAFGFCAGQPRDDARLRREVHELGAGEARVHHPVPVDDDHPGPRAALRIDQTELRVQIPCAGDHGKRGGPGPALLTGRDDDHDRLQSVVLFLVGGDLLQIVRALRIIQ